MYYLYIQCINSLLFLHERNALMLTTIEIEKACLLVPDNVGYWGTN